MGARTSPQALLQRLDADVATAIRGREPIVIAFSGGLASLLLAALIRKRREIVCEVLGLPGSADLEAARVAEKFLDYRVRAVRATPSQVLRTARGLVRPGRLTTPEAMALVPLALIAARHPREPVVSGFGLTWDSPRVRASLLSGSSACPALQPRGVAPPSRRTLLGVADLLGLPEAFSRAARRRPAEGSGVGPVLRAAAHAEHVSLDRFLRVDVPSDDYHERTATRVIPKSSSVD